MKIKIPNTFNNTYLDNTDKLIEILEEEIKTKEEILTRVRGERNYLIWERKAYKPISELYSLCGSNKVASIVFWFDDVDYANHEFVNQSYHEVYFKDDELVVKDTYYGDTPDWFDKIVGFTDLVLESR